MRFLVKDPSPKDAIVTLRQAFPKEVSEFINGIQVLRFSSGELWRIGVNDMEGLEACGVRIDSERHIVVK